MTTKTRPGRPAAGPPRGTNVADLWRTYAADRSSENRNQLIQAYLPLVRNIAERMHAHLARQVDADDLISCGVMGLMGAIEAFDPRRGTRFESFCAARIRGAMLDEVRSMDWVPRLARLRARQLAQAAQGFHTEQGRPPSETELAQCVGLPGLKLTRLQADLHAARFASLSHVLDREGQERLLGQALADERAEDPLRAAMRSDLAEAVLKGLSHTERLIIMLYYGEDMTMAEVGQALGVSESRICQMHSQVLALLRARFGRSQLFAIPPANDDTEDLPPRPAA